MRNQIKYLWAAVLAVALLLAGALYFAGKPRPVPPLPFDSTNFVSTTPPDSPFNPSATWSFPASPKRACSIQGLLNQCAAVTGMRYLMPKGIAGGMVQFGNTNTLSGPQWVLSFEKELQTSDVQYWDAQTKRAKWDHLAFLRFPAQKIILVLPESGVADFERTNGIHIPR